MDELFHLPVPSVRVEYEVRTGYQYGPVAHPVSQREDDADLARPTLFRVVHVDQVGPALLLESIFLIGDQCSYKESKVIINS